MARGSSAAAKPTIGILSAGEMGAALGGILVRQGYRVLTSAAERSERTCRRAESAGLELTLSVAALAQIADVVLSVVPPSAAVGVAEQYCGQASPVRNRLFVDLNAIAPVSVARTDELCRRHGVRFVDGAVHGMAARLPQHGTMYLSGPFAQEVAALFAPSLRVKILGGPVGQASAFKMMISGMAKGVVALFVEMALAARQAELLTELLECYGDAYPGIMALVERLLPTYPQHAARRGDELEEVEQTMRALGLEPDMVAAARRTTTALGKIAWVEHAIPQDGSEWSVRTVIEAIYAEHPLNAIQG